METSTKLITPFNAVTITLTIIIREWVKKQPQKWVGNLNSNQLFGIFINSDFYGLKNTRQVEAWYCNAKQWISVNVKVVIPLVNAPVQLMHVCVFYLQTYPLYSVYLIPSDIYICSVHSQLHEKECLSSSTRILLECFLKGNLFTSKVPKYFCDTSRILRCKIIVVYFFFVP